MEISITSSSPTNDSKFKLEMDLVPLIEKKLCHFELKCEDSDSCKHGENCKDLHHEITKTNRLKVYQTQANLAPILAFSAGILPYSINHSDHDVYFLMGKEKKNKYVWCDFGGRYASEDKSHLYTAAREACEETMGLIGRTDDNITEDILSKKNLMISINYIEGLLLREQGVYHIDVSNYQQYLCHIPWINEDVLNDALVLNRKKEYKLRHVEKLEYKWIKGFVLLNLIEEMIENEGKEEKQKIGIKNGNSIEGFRKSFIPGLKASYVFIKQIIDNNLFE
eukprot:gene10770-3389_t